MTQKISCVLYLVCLAHPPHYFLHHLDRPAVFLEKSHLQKNEFVVTVAGLTTTEIHVTLLTNLFYSIGFFQEPPAFVVIYQTVTVVVYTRFSPMSFYRHCDMVFDYSSYPFLFLFTYFFLLLHLVFLLLSFYQHCDKTVNVLDYLPFFNVYCCILFGFFLGPPAIQKISTSSVAAYAYTLNTNVVLKE